MSEAADLLRNRAKESGPPAKEGASAVSLLRSHAAGEVPPSLAAAPRAAPKPWSQRSLSEKMFPEIDYLEDQNQAMADAGGMIVGSMHPEVVLSGITGGAGSLADTVTFSDPGTHDWAYRPRTASGQAAEHWSSAPISQLIGPQDGDSPLVQTLKERVPQFLGAAGTVAGAASLGRAGSGVLRRSGMPEGEALGSMSNDPQSMGAAAAAVDTSRLSPQLKQVVELASKEGPLNRAVLDRHVDADTLPIPIRLTRGQAMQDPYTISNEMNLRGKNPERAEFYRQQNAALIDNMDEIRAEAGPTVVHRDHVQNGQALVDAYKEMDAPIKADIDAKYQALRDAAGGDFPIDATALYENMKTALKKELLSKEAPASQLSEIAELAESGNMTFEHFLSLRRNLGNIARTASDGNTRYAAGIMVRELEDLPLKGGAAELKPLADAARSAARARFERMRADPAYRAAAEDPTPMGEASTEADTFVKKYVINGKAANIERMRENLAGNEEAGQTITVSALNYLKDGSEGRAKSGNFSQAGYNSALNHLAPRLQLLMPEAVAEQAQQLGRVANYTQFQPRGSFVNNSNTFTAQAAESAKTAMEGVLNVKSGGIPVGTYVRKRLDKKAEDAAWADVTAPGSGIKLSELLKGKRK